MEIYCPKCRWEPPADARWSCTCGHTWNTFDTTGRCPACGKVWRDTQCLACHAWSKHHDWYHDLPPVDAAEAERSAGARLVGSPSFVSRFAPVGSPDDEPKVSES